ncbi:uncharacterized protein J3D65DRAFT_668752 [Phyllosticta citribraziliensis]|uniref:Uncharacterized protein n=1 Tax=Phyllosticta citribraziliensis TaxID=989973 RepID=A0ABR1LQQ1_9PEZI
MPSSMLEQIVASSALSATSNVLAQIMTAQKQGQPFSFDIAAFLKFVLCTVISTPPNVLWQEYLEEQFPGTTKDKKKKSTKAKDDKNEKRTPDAADEGQRNWWNVFMKFFLDQTVGAFVNIVLFVATIRALNGSGSDEIYAAIKDGMWPIYSAGLKLWPLVSVISFTVVPVDKRVVFGSVVGVAWGVYLSLVAAES